MTSVFIKKNSNFNTQFNCQLSSRYLSGVNCQLSTVNCQLSTVNCHPDTYRESTVNCQLSINNVLKNVIPENKDHQCDKNYEAHHLSTLHEFIA